MPREDVCAHCGSNNTQAGFDAIQCLVCGNRTDAFDGGKLPVEPSFPGTNRYTERPS